MTPTQSQLWQFLGQPSWHCAHPERLPLAPAPVLPAAEVLMVLGQGVTLTDIFSADLLTALSLTACQLQTLSQAEWLAADKPKARVLLGLNVTAELDAFHWQASVAHSVSTATSPTTTSPVLSAAQKRALWSCLCRYYLDH